MWTLYSEVLSMFGPTAIPQFPRPLNRRLKTPMKCAWISLGITLGTMFLTEGWRWLFDVKGTRYLFEGVPVVFQWLTFAGLISFVISLFATLFAVPLWYDIEVRWKIWKQQRRRRRA